MPRADLLKLVSAKFTRKTPPAPPAMPALSVLTCATMPGIAIPKGPNDAVGPDQSNQQTGLCKFCKDVISAGSYTHPEKGWSLKVTPERMEKWCAAFAAMSADGVKVPIYADHKPSAQSHLGYLSALFRGGPDALKHPGIEKLPVGSAPLDEKRLFAIHEFKDDASAALAKGVGQVSVLIDKDFTAGNGKKYGEAIRHVAVTPEPIVANQQPFCQLAAGRGDDAKDIPLFVLQDSRQAAEKNMLTDKELELARVQFSEADVKDLTADNAVERLCAKLETLSKAALDQQKELDEAKAKAGTVALSAIDQDALDMLAEATQEKLDGLVKDEKLTPGSAKQLAAALIGDEKARNTYALSRHVSKTPKSIAAMVIEALAENKPLKLGEKTKPQHVALARQVPGGEDAAKLAAEEKKVAETMDSAGNRGRKAK